MSTPLIPTVPAPVHFSMYAMPGNPHVQAPLVTVAPNPAQQQQQVVNSGPIRNCIRLRGMPYSATAEDILNFLGDLSYYILPNGVHMVLNQQGRPSGDAFIQLNSADKAAQAAQDVSKGGCHKRHMGERYVEVFQCSGDEMNMVLMGGTLNRNGIQPPPGMALIQEQQVPAASPTLPNPATALTAAAAYPSPVSANPISPLMLPQPSIDYMPPALFQTIPRQLYPQPTYIPYPLQGSPFVPQVSLGNAAALQALAASQGALPPQLAAMPAAPAGVQVRMQGVPYNTGVSDILTFFKGYNQQNAVYSNGALEGSPRPFDNPSHVGDDKTQVENATRPGEWTCIA